MVLIDFIGVKKYLHTIAVKFFEKIKCNKDLNKKTTMQTSRFVNKAYNLIIPVPKNETLC